VQDELVDSKWHASARCAARDRETSLDSASWLSYKPLPEVLLLPVGILVRNFRDASIPDATKEMPYVATSTARGNSVLVYVLNECTYDDLG